MSLLNLMTFDYDVNYRYFFSNYLWYYNSEKLIFFFLL